MDKMLQWTLRLGQNVTVDVVNLDVTSRQPFYSAEFYGALCRKFRGRPRISVQITTRNSEEIPVPVLHCTWYGHGQRQGVGMATGMATGMGMDMGMGMATGIGMGMGMGMGEHMGVHIYMDMDM